jgi:hypothetical protein
MSTPGVRTVFCPAGTWTQVTWLVAIGLSVSYHYVAGTHVDWRWFSAGIPPYWQGSFDGDAVITLSGLYTSLEFNPRTSTTVSIYAG